MNYCKIKMQSIWNTFDFFDSKCSSLHFYFVRRWFVHNNLLQMARLGIYSMLKLIIGNH